MSNIVSLDNLFHRSRARIKDLGEVFTPESYVEDMLTLLGKDKRGLWADEDTAFFEPSCGHGNIVISIYRKRLEAIYKKAQTNGVRDAAYYAVANAINTLWAIDIDSKNINQCRTRVVSTTFEFLKEKLNIESEYYIISKRQEFVSHLLCAINWHIDENETLSALSDIDTAQFNARQTKAGAKWFSQNGHQPIDFDLSWASYFENCKKESSIPLDYERASRFVKNILVGSSKGFSDFEFAKYLLDIEKPTSKAPRRSKDLSIGA
jgi:hypothetical protein